MRPYFTRERFGRPQFLAGLLLLCFLAQALWLVHAELHTAHQPDGTEAVRIGEGWKQWNGRGVAAALRCFCRAFAGLAAGFWRRFGNVLALASADSVSRLRRFSGRVAVVCG